MVATCSEFINPLNFSCLFMNTFAEGQIIFAAIVYIIFGFLAAFFRMSQITFVVMLVLLTLIMKEYLMVFDAIFYFVLIIGGAIMFLTLRKLNKN